MELNLILNKPILFLILCGFFQCAGIAKRTEYTSSINSWQAGDALLSAEKLPRTEKKGFIATLEKAHIQFFAGESEYSDLETLAMKSKERLRFSATESLKSFFYLETEEGYYASEAEIIYLHILLGMYYVRSQNFEKATVQARYAGNLLSGEWSAEGQFDDPTLRLLLASLWISTGNWEEAKVDLRKASQLKPSSSYLKNLANLQKPPKEFYVIFGGPGAEPSMNPTANINFIRGLRNLEFIMKGSESNLTIADVKRKINLHLEKNTKIWYDRHIVRDNAMSEIIEDSKYFQRVTGTALKEGTKGTARVGLAVVVGATLVGFGAAVVYYASQVSAAGDFVALGIGVMIIGFQTGGEMADDAIRDTERNVKRDLDISGNYRFVRFMPEYIWVGTNQNEELKSSKLILPKKDAPFILTSPQGKTSVLYGFVPDVKE